MHFRVIQEIALQSEVLRVVSDESSALNFQLKHLSETLSAQTLNI